MPLELTPSRADYIRRVNRVIDHIDSHLTESLHLEDLARVAAFSPFHFHRVFKALAGDTLFDWILRQRLERAATALIYDPNTPITNIALDCGFSSSSNFARAFKLHFGMTASAYRKKRKISQTDRKQREVLLAETGHRLIITETNEYDDLTPIAAPPVVFENLPSWRLAYVRIIGRYDDEAILAAWDRIMRWAIGRQLLTDASELVGVPHDDPEITPAGKCRYDACLVVDDHVEAEGDVGVCGSPGGAYAIWHRVMPGDEIGDGWNEMYRDWLPDSGFQPDSRPCLELYGNGSVLPDGKYRVAYCLPIKPL